MNKRTLRVYDKEFKLNAIELCFNSDRSVKTRSMELGIPSATLATWIDNHKKEGQEAFPGKGNLKASDANVAQLGKKLSVA